MKKKQLIALMLSGAMAIGAYGGLVACGGDDQPPTTSCTQHVDEDNNGKCDICGETMPITCTKHVDSNADGKCDVCGETMPTAPVITVNPKAVTLYAGDPIVLKDGVSAVDSKGNAVEVTVVEDDDIDPDNPEEGTYTVKYKATADGLDSFETRTYTVNAELAPIVMQARKAWGKGEVWVSTDKLVFRHREYHELTADYTTEDRLTGVFHNKSEQAIVVTVKCGGGVAAIFDKNGVLVEGRDGANGKLVNAQNPSRGNSSVSSFEYNGEQVSVATETGKAMTVPAGGIAVVVQSNHFGQGSADADGRSYFNYNIINEYPNVVRFYFDDPEAEEVEYLTPYVNQAPTVTGNTEIFVLPNQAGFELEAEVKKGLTVKDDNGTFDLADDATLTAEAITITDQGGFDIATEGDYVITFTATDGTATSTYTRKVKVVGEEYISKLSINNGTQYTYLKKDIVKDTYLSKPGSYSLIVYTYEYKAAHAEDADKGLGFTNGYGEAYIVDKYGKIVRTYDGANAKYSDATHKSAEGIITYSNYMQKAYESLSENELVFIAPNDSGKNNVTNSGSRWVMMQPGNRESIGKDFDLTGFEWEEKPFTLSVGNVSCSALESKYGYNVAITDTQNFDMAVFKGYTGAVPCSTVTTGYAAIVDKYGALKAVYDGVNNKKYTSSTDAGTDLTVTEKSFAVQAYEALAEGDMLVLLISQENITAAANLKAHIGTDVTFTDVIFAERTVELAVGANKLTINISDYKLNETGASKVELFKGATTAPTFTDYAKGVAVVVNQFGEIVKVYDGVNNKLYDGTEGGATLDVSASNYAAQAYAAVEQGGAVIVFKGESGDHITYALALKDSLDGTVTFTDVNFEQRGLKITAKDGAKSYLVKGEHYLENTKVTSPNNKYLMLVYDYGYTEESFGQGWAYGAALVVDAQGKLVRIYDGANGGVYDSTGKIANPDGFGQTTYATVAFNSLVEGERLIVFPHCPDLTANSGRNFALGCRFDDSIGKAVTITDTRKPAQA